MKYIAWIPTNAGYLNSSHILTPKWQKDTSVSNAYFLPKQELHVYDTIEEGNLSKQTIFQATCMLDFSNSLLWEFAIDVYDKEMHIIQSSGKIHINGKTEFVCNTVNHNLLDPVIDGENLPNTIFTFLKQQVHRDLHHLEKVDNVIPICVNEKDWGNETADRLVKKIKALEF